MRIGTLAHRAGVGTKTVRYYEASGLLPTPKRMPNGYRTYTDGDLTRLQFIRRAQAAGLSLQAIRDILTLHDEGQRPCLHLEALAEEHVAVINRRIAELESVRASLVELAGRAQSVARADSCNASDICSAVPLTVDAGRVSA